MNVSEELKSRLTAAFAPDVLEIVNDSHRHAGHSGDDGSGDSHYSIKLRAAALTPLTRVARHRAVHAALGNLNERIHAIALDLG